MIERYSVWEAHGKKCFYCNEPLPYRLITIDHLLPESLLSQQNRLQEITIEYGLNKDFKINNYYNWVPACSSCNSKKRDRVPKKETALHYLEIAEEKYVKIKKLEEDLKARNRKDKLITNLDFFLEQGLISPEEIKDRILSVNSKNKDIFTFIVNNFCSLIQEKLYQDAIVYIQKAIEMFPEDDTGFGYYSLGFCYLQLKDYQSVICNCTKAININPKLGLAYFLRGQAYFLPYYSRFIHDEDKISNILERLDKCEGDVVSINHYNRAISNYNQAIEVIPNNPENFYWRAICKLFMATKFRSQFFDDEDPYIPIEPIDDLCKAAEIYFKESKLSKCKETLKIYSELVEIHQVYKIIFPDYEDAKQLLNLWNSDYFEGIEDWTE